MVKIPPQTVNSFLYQECVRALFTPISQKEVAEALDCSVNAVRQALMDPATPGFRNPPGGWEVTVRRLLEAKANHFTKLAKRLSPKE